MSPLPPKQYGLFQFQENNGIPENISKYAVYIERKNKYWLIIDKENKKRTTQK